MNISIFFSFIIVGLLAIFFIFKPLNIEQQKFDEIPIFELENFELLELNSKGLTTVMNGSNGIRYIDRYLIDKMNYTDNSKQYIANMVSEKALYKNNIIDLQNDVVFTREDGISFITQKALYNKNTNVVTSPGKYFATLGKHKMKGSYIEYNNLSKTIESKNVNIVYKLREKQL